MRVTCPRCGFEAVDGSECSRCGVDVARYQAEMAQSLASRDRAATAETMERASASRSHAPAGFWIRSAAILIDVVILMTAQALFAFLVWSLLRPKSPRLMAAAVSAFRLVVDSAYFIVLSWLWGQTLGKMAMQIRVVTVDGGALTLPRSGLRWFGLLLSTATFGVGYLLAGLRGDKRALHDLIAGTRVERLS